MSAGFIMLYGLFGMFLGVIIGVYAMSQEMKRRLNRKHEDLRQSELHVIHWRSQYNESISKGDKLENEVERLKEQIARIEKQRDDAEELSKNTITEVLAFKIRIDSVYRKLLQRRDGVPESPCKIDPEAE